MHGPNVPESTETRERRFQIDASFTALKQLGQELTEFVESSLGRESESSKAVHDLKLAVQEAATNLIEHGRLDPPEGAIDVRLELRERTITVSLTCGGASFDPRRISAEPPPPEALAEGGYGLYLMRTLSDDIDYVTRDGRHTLSLYKHLDARRAG